MRWTIVKTKLVPDILFLFPISVTIYFLYRQIEQAVDFTYLEFLLPYIIIFYTFSLNSYSFAMAYFTGVGIGTVRKPDLAELNKVRIPFAGRISLNFTLLFIIFFSLVNILKDVQFGIQALIVFTYLCAVFIGSHTGIYMGKRVFRKILSLKGPASLWDEEMMRELRR